MSIISVLGTIIGGNNVIAGGNNVITSGNNVITGTNNVISGGAGAAGDGDFGDNNETPDVNKPAMIDVKAANRIARNLLNWDEPDNRWNASITRLKYSAVEIDFLNAKDAIVYILPDSSEIEFNFVDANAHLPVIKTYPMTNRTKRLAQRARKYFSRPRPDAAKAFLIVLLSIVGGVVVLPVSAALIHHYSPRQQRIRKQYNEFKSTLPNYADSIRMAETPEEFARFKNLQEFNDQRLANYWTELQQGK